MSIKLRDLIRSVRTCKTASEERSVISLESALIRTAIKEEQETFRHRNVAKLLFMHMLGYPTHFGQLETLKLIASPYFPEKRIGYLGIMLLLSEEADVLMLSTNSLKGDLGNGNMYITGLSLCAIGNLATPDMSHDLSTEVSKHLRSGSPYLRKKASLAMIRILTKAPDLIEDHVDKIVSLLKDRSHGVLITSVQLMIQICELDIIQGRAAFTRLVPTLVRLLRNLLSMGYSPDHDVSGISDPFLQVTLLQLLRILGNGDAEASESMNDILAQVSTNTETGKNAGNAILYECVLTIMGIESDVGLKTLAVNILGRFLLNRDNNIRYVALNTLSRVIAIDNASVQRHKITIVECLKDPDVSIRQRALELVFRLINSDNVVLLTVELLNYIVVCDVAHKSDICTRILHVVDKYGPSVRYKVTTLITMLSISGSECSPEVLNSVITFVSGGEEELRRFATHKLVRFMAEEVALLAVGENAQEGLQIVGIWCVGEFGEVLLEGYEDVSAVSSDAGAGAGVDGSASDGNDIASSSPSSSSNSQFTVKYPAHTALSVISLLEKVTKRPSCPDSVKMIALTSFAKLTQRFLNEQSADNDAVMSKLRMNVKRYGSSMSLELQVRAVEYGVMIDEDNNASNNSIKVGGEDGVLSRMPVLDKHAVERKVMARKRREEGEDHEGDEHEEQDEDSVMPIVSGIGSASANGGGKDLLDLDDIFGGGHDNNNSNSRNNNNNVSVTSSSNGDSNGQGQSNNNNSSGVSSDADLLSDIFSSQPPLQQTYNNNNNNNSSSSSSSGNDNNADYSSSNGGNGYIQQQQQQQVDVLDVFGGGGGNSNNNNSISNDPFAIQPPMPPQTNNNNNNNNNNMLDSAASQIPTSTPPPPPTSDSNSDSNSPPTITAYDSDGLKITFTLTRSPATANNETTVTASFKNSTATDMTALIFQVAVPKYLSMTMFPPSSTTIPCNNAGDVRQEVKVVNNSGNGGNRKKIMFKIKIGYVVKGVKRDLVATANNFPEGY